MTKARDTANLVATGVPNSLITLDAAEIPNLDANKITSGTLDNARITLDAAEIPNLDTAKVTSGTFANARISAGSVTQHVSATDLTPVRQDILTLGLKQAVQENSTKFNLPNSAITKFEADADFNLAGSTTVGRNASEYINTITTATDYDQTMSTTRANCTILSGGWTNSITNDSFSSPAGTGGDYPSAYVNWIYDLATDWKIKVFEVARTDGENDLTENFQTWNSLITTDTSIAAGADTATSSADGRAWRQTDDSSDTSSTDYLISPTEWGDTQLIASYASTIGSDSAYDNYGEAAFGHQQIDCSTLTSPFINRCYSYTAHSYGWLVEYDRTANTITIRQPTNTAWTSFSSNKTTFSNVPETGRFFFKVGSGGGQSSRTTYYSTTYKDVADADKGYVKVDTFNATGTALGTTNVPTSAVTDVSGVMLLKNNSGTNTLGTDVKVYFTADNSNWTEAASYADAGTFSTGIKMIKLGKTTCTSGSDVRWKVVFANQASGSKEAQIYGIGLNY